ncbi:RES family NAD+ phosphorylase, partial [Halobacillus litoralis]|uniref:RES family NAD+ phosphorylase n=1 Tax=Halobacillus litoralis TaxID=45668 RepID=UPI001CD3785C
KAIASLRPSRYPLGEVGKGQEIGGLHKVVEQMGGTNKAIASLRPSRYPLGEIGKRQEIGGLHKVVEQMGGTNKAIASLRPSRYPLGEIGKRQEIGGLHKVVEQMGGTNKAIDSLRPPKYPFGEIGKSLDSYKSLSLNNIGWVLPKPAIEQASRYSNVDRVRNSFKKIPRSQYDILPRITEDSSSNETEWVVRNKETNDTVPFDDVTSTIGITDIIESLSIDEVFAFYDFLVKYPMLGLKHEVGRKIFDEIGKVSLTEFQGKTLFRARKRNCYERHAPFTEMEMFQAPHGLPVQGRFNVTGHGELYASSCEETALEEVDTKEEDDRFEIIEWILKEPVKLIDLSGYDSALSEYSSYESMTPNNQEYLIPNFLSQCVKANNIAGIRFNSVKKPSNKNYVFFHFQQNWFEKVNIKIGVMSYAFQKQSHNQ